MGSSARPQVSTHPLRTICLTLIAFGLLAAGLVLVQRVKTESASRAVDIVVDYTEVVDLAMLHGQSPSVVLRRMRDAGATAAAVPESTLNALEGQGALVVNPAGASPVTSNGQLPKWMSGGDPVTRVIFNDPAVLPWVRAALKRTLPTGSVVEVTHGTQPMLVMHGARELVGGLGLGLDPHRVAAIDAAGLRVMPRLHGGTDLSAVQLDAALAALANTLPPTPKNRPRATLIFEGDTLPGYRDSIVSLADGLRKYNLAYGAVEFAKQKGDAQLGAKLKGELVRVHSISLIELATLAQPTAVQRFGLAVKDRNIRVLFVRFPPLASEDPVLSAKNYVDEVTKEVRAQGFTVSTDSPAHPFPLVAVPPAALTFLFIAAGASLLLWLCLVLPAQLPASMVRVGALVLGLGILGAAGLALVKPGEGRMLFGVLAGIGFPLLALTWTYTYARDRATRRDVRPLVAAVAVLLVATAISLAGGLLVAAMMSETRYLVKVGQFAGVKATLAIPLLLFAAIIVVDGVARAGETLEQYGARCRQAAHDFLRQPVYLWSIIAAVVGMLVLAILMARSGNEGMDVSSGEMSLRTTLEQWLIARPRTKEFLIGHPLFLGGIVAATTDRRMLAMFLLLGGAIGQMDVFNTYCHAHTPVLLSLLRTFNGLWLGLLIGLASILIFGRKALKEKEKIAPVAAE